MIFLVSRLPVKSRPHPTTLLAEGHHPPQGDKQEINISVVKFVETLGSGIQISKSMKFNVLDIGRLSQASLQNAEFRIMT